MTKIRVLIVEDSLTVRKHLVNCLQADPELQVIAEAEDGKQAIELCERLRPDVITLDMMLPVMNGLSATEYIMAYRPTPIVIVSASTNRGKLLQTYEALAAGALEVVEKPDVDTIDTDWAKKLVSIVKLAARVKVITHPRGRLKRPHKVEEASSSAIGTSTRQYHYVAMGVSTGGPQALATILSALPADFPLPIILVMHISPAFGGSFAEWLSDQSSIPVTMAHEDRPLPHFGTPGVILAPADRHLIVRGKRLCVTSESEVHSCRPSVDVLFQSVAQEIGNRAIGVLLTGMGRDGARGLLDLRNAGAMTLAQDEATSIVYGMPREAVLLRAAIRVLPLDGIAPALVAMSNTTGVEETRK